MSAVRVIASVLIGMFILFSSAQANWRQALPSAELAGSGEMRFFGFALYDAQFWTQGVPAEALALQAPFALQLTYKRTISRDDLVAASLKEIRRLASREPDPKQLLHWEGEMQKAFVDVRVGDRITGVYLPEQGVHFYVGDRLQHVVPGDEFATAFFGIWLDSRTRNPKLREQLIGAKRS